MNDAASAAVLMSRDKANQLGIKPMGKIIAYAGGGVDPAFMGLGPIPAIRKALKKAGMTLDQIDLIELNEAFASQAIACIKELKVNTDKCNMFGGGISLGHPIGCTGARLVTTALYQMKRLGLKYGLFQCVSAAARDLRLLSRTRHNNMEYKNLLVEINDGIGILKINRPKALNSLNSETLVEIKDAGEKLNNDPLCG